MEPLQVAPEELVVLPFRSGKVVQVTHHMYEALHMLRPALIDVARNHLTISYAAASAATLGAYLPQGMGPVLDVLSIECDRRGEPSLAPLVVRKDAGEVGDAFVGDAAAGRQECYAYWQGR